MFILPLFNNKLVEEVEGISNVNTLVKKQKGIFLKYTLGI